MYGSGYGDCLRRAHENYFDKQLLAFDRQIDIHVTRKIAGKDAAFDYKPSVPNY